MIQSPAPSGARPLGARLPDAAALLAVAIWGASFTLQKVALREIDAMAFTFVRYVGMIALGWAVLLGRRAAGRPLGVRRQDLPRMAVTGVLGYSLYIVLSTVGLARTTAFSTALLAGTAPLFAVALAALLNREVVRPWAAAGMAVALAGAAVFMAEKLRGALPEAGAGDLLSLAGAFFFAAYSVAQKPLLDRYAVPVMMAYTCTLGALPVLLLAWPAALAQDWRGLSWLAWASLAWTTVVPVYLAWSLWAWAIARAGVSRTSLFMFLVPVWGGVSSHVLLGETFDGLKLAGAGLILAGLALARRDGAPAGAPAARSGVPSRVPARAGRSW